MAATAKAVKVPEAPDSVAEQRGSCLPSLHEAGGNEAAGSHAASVKPAHVEKDALSSPKDDSSLDETPSGDWPKLPDKLPFDSQIPQWRTLSQCLRKKGDTRKKLHLLAHRLQEMSLGADQTTPPSGAVKNPGPNATEMSWMWSGTARMAVDTEDNQGDNFAGNGDAGGNNAPNPPPPAALLTEPPADGGANVLRGGDDLHDGDENMEGNNSDLNEWGQTSFTGP